MGNDFRLLLKEYGEYIQKWRRNRTIWVTTLDCYWKSMESIYRNEEGIEQYNQSINQTNSVIGKWIIKF
jgi:hypothetical protein